MRRLSKRAEGEGGKEMKTLEIWSLLERKGFFHLMRERFQQAEHKNLEPTLSNIHISALFRHLHEEIGELQLALDQYDSDRSSPDLNITNLLEELGDVANMCGLIYVKLLSRG